MNEEPKIIFKSKTALVGALTALAGALGTASEPVQQFLSDHASVILMVTGVVAVGLRMLTKGRVKLFAD